MKINDEINARSPFYFVFITRFKINIYCTLFILSILRKKSTYHIFKGNSLGHVKCQRLLK